ncbi:rhamnogalacturonan acetylesterase [Streptomyces roseolus]|uniref:rhamnogalacturonan acetylesterase n=1 Tax=Streptomyces roseolus TaxID=67358 RepID=UPI00167624CC|nr:rhamnogalacturonan acetylesterase [Streptomyces roseolus]GGR46673.1 rhamnogalacturonan acetylesterase RhgT [Streptomyces roseolus]
MTTVYLAGDSSVTSRQRSMAPMVGWGQTLPLFVHGAEVVNCARAGSSTRSFLERGRLAWILENIVPGDLLLISFGLIDMKPGDGRFTEPFVDYQRFLRRYVHEARDHGAHPVLVTSHERRVFDKFGNMRRPLGLYPAAMREVAADLSVPLIDLNEWSVAWWRQAGPEGTKEIFLYLNPGEHPNYPKGIADNTHLRAHGAVECSRFIAEELRSRGLLPPAFFRDLDRRFDPERAVEFLDDAEFDRLTKERVAEVRR